MGEFGVIARNTPQALRTLLERPDLRFGPHAPLTVRPTRGMLARLADYSGTSDLALLLDWFAAARTAGSPYSCRNWRRFAGLRQLLDERSLAFADKLNLLFIPADLEKDAEVRLFTSIIQAIERGEKMPVGHVVPARTEGLDDQSLEDLSRACDLYYWASRRFPVLFPIATRRPAAGRLIRPSRRDSGIPWTPPARAGAWAAQAGVPGCAAQAFRAQAALTADRVIADQKISCFRGSVPDVAGRR